MDQQPFPFDPQMPELARAADCATMCDLLAQHLWRDDPQRVRVEECRITRIRYRPRARCFLQYAMTLRDTQTAALRHQWVTGSLYAEPTRAARLAQTLSDAAFIPELRMLVNIFPSDYKLPHCGTIMRGEDPELQAAVLRTFDGDGWRVENWTTEPVRYREHLSLVVRYTVRARNVRTGEANEKVFYLKAYPECESARHMFQYLNDLARHVARAPVGIRIDPPVAYLGHLGAVLLPSTEGRPLSSIIASDDERGVPCAVGEAARALARFNLSDAPTTRRYPAAEYVRSLERPVTVLEWACPELRADLHGILRMVAREARDVPAKPTHRDMKPDHIMIPFEGGSPGFIDLDSCAAADPLLDVALMLARFPAMALNGAGRQRSVAVARVFADEYFACVPADWRGRLPVYYASSLVEVAAGMFHRQEDAWSRRVPPMVRTAAGILRGELLLSGL